jgi:uncharacterized protein involved in exopolysaccharide biosynthesis
MQETEHMIVHSGDEIDLLDLLIVLAKRKRQIFRFTAGMAILAVIISLILPKIFTASTTILPPQRNQSSAAAMLGQLGALAGMAGASMGIKNPSDMYIGMLKSRNVEDDLVKRFNLKSLYKTDLEEIARKTLESNTSISSGKDGFIKIEFSDKDPRRAADIANAYVSELDRLTSSLAVTEASQRRLFFEKQLNLVKENLSKAEFDLQKLQAKAGLIQVYPLEKELAESSAKLRAQIAAKEVQLSAMRVGVTPSNPEYIRLQGEIESLKKKLDGSDGGNGFDPSMSKESLEYIQKFRNVKYNQAVLEMLYKQYELAKIDEAKDYPMIQVLDRATPPEKKSKPKRALIVILSTLAAFFVSIFYAFMKEAMDKANADPERSGKLAMFREFASLKRKLS